MRGRKTGGRKAGTPNKATKETRDWINDFIMSVREDIKRDFHTLEPQQRIRIFLQLLNYVVPKQQSIAPALMDDEQNNFDNKIVIIEGNEELQRLEHLRDELKALGVDDRTLDYN